MRAINFYIGLLLVTAGTLMFQVIETRIISVITWYYLSFFVISIAMFGLTAGAVWVYLQGGRFTKETLSSDLSYFSGAFSISTLLSLVIQLSLRLEMIEWTRLESVLILGGTWAILVVAIALPFFYSGVVVSLALTRSPFPIGRVYGVDLIGAAGGCLGVLLLLDVVDGPTALLWVGALVGLAGAFFRAARIGDRDSGRNPLGRVLGRSAAVAAVVAGFALFNGVTDLGIRPAYIKGHQMTAANRPIFEEWNTFSRIAMRNAVSREPRMWAASPALDKSQWLVDQKILTIDGDAGTTSYGIEGDIGRAGFLRHDVTSLAYYLPDRNRAAVMGVGGGRDMLAARVFGVSEVVGVEINPIIMRLVTEDPSLAGFTGLADMDGMTFQIDEARSWFARSREQFDVVQMALVDTWAATGAGANTLSENGLYTVEAWRLFLDRLTPDGVFTVSRWHGEGEVNETGRMVSLAAATVMELGARQPGRHMFLVSAGRIATLVLSRSPLRPDYVEKLEQVAQDAGFEVLVSPGRPPASTTLRRILESSSLAELQSFTASLSLDLTPPTDDRPFFFNQLPLANLSLFITETLPDLSQGVAQGNVRATLTLVLLIALSFVLVVSTIVLPLRPGIRDVGDRIALGGTVYFLLIGMGFMFVEIALLQRMSVFLGHPIYSLGVVLFSMILATGLGSLLSERVKLESRPSFATWSLLCGCYVFALAFWIPPVQHWLESEGLIVRAAAVVALIAPAGLLLGFGFPTGLRMISAVNPRPTPWFWGINGAAGVLSSSLAVLFSMTFGISTTLMLGAFCYWLLIPVAWIFGLWNRETRSNKTAIPAVS